MEVEKRNTPFAPSLRADGGASGTGNKLVGYAARFGAEFQLYEGCIETIAPGAFKRSLEVNPDVRGLFDHNTSDLLGRTTSGTLRLREDSQGLAFELDLPDTQAGRDVRTLVSRGDLTGCSFGFIVAPGGEKIAKRADGTILRTLTDVDLFEITVCPFPAYEATSVQLRARIAKRHHPRLALSRLKARLLNSGL